MRASSRAQALVARVLLGARLGFLIGVFLAILASVAWLIGGSALSDRIGVGFVRVVVLDILLASVIGGIVGLSRPLLQSRFAAFLAGCMLGLPVALLIGVSRGEGLPREPLDWFVPVVFAIAMGGSLGLIFRDIFSGGSTRK